MIRLPKYKLAGELLRMLHGAGLGGYLLNYKPESQHLGNSGLPWLKSILNEPEHSVEYHAISQ